MKEKINALQNQFQEDCKAIENLASLEELRLAYMGKKGKVTDLMANFREVPADQKKEVGMLVNQLKNGIETKIAELKEELANKAINEEIAKSKAFDITLPVNTGVGSLHPRTIIQKQVVDTFVSMGFIIEDGNEVETEYNNFISVNVPDTHPARDMHFTFWTIGF